MAQESGEDRDRGTVTPPRIAVHEETLDNGLRLLLSPSHHAPIVSVSLWYRTGSRHDPPGQGGLAHLLEHMLYKGTHRHPRGEYDRLLHAQGAAHNASTWFERTNYYILISSDRYPLALELEADRVRGALLAEEDLRDEIPVIVNELQRNEDDPETALHERLLARAFPEHPYGRPVGGTPEEVRALTGAALRDFYDRHYRPNQAYLVISGDYDEARVRDEVEASFGSLEPGPVRVTEPLAPAQQEGERRFELRRAGRHEVVSIGYRAPARQHPDCLALDLLAQVLGQGRASRLHRALVEPGLAVQVGAENQAVLCDPFLFAVDLYPARGVALGALEEALEREIERLRREPVGEAELARAHKQARVAFVRRAERVSSRAALIGELERTVGWRYQTDYLVRLAETGQEDLERAADRYLRPESRTLGHFLPLPEAAAAEPAAEDAP